MEMRNLGKTWAFHDEKPILYNNYNVHARFRIRICTFIKFKNEKYEGEIFILSKIKLKIPIFNDVQKLLFYVHTCSKLIMLCLVLKNTTNLG
jgi:hypothetical protein